MKSKRIRLLVVAAFAAACPLPAIAADSALGPGRHCELLNPPRDAQRTRLQGAELFVFPATPGTDYSGCVWIWRVAGAGTRVEDVAKFQKGQPVFYRRTRQSVQSFRTECTYEAGRLRSRKNTPPGWTSDDCPGAASLRGMLDGKPVN